jgi:hypothetical protein
LTLGVNKASSEDKRQETLTSLEALDGIDEAHGLAKSVSVSTVELAPWYSEHKALFSLVSLAQGRAAQSRPICTTRSGMV